MSQIQISDLSFCYEGSDHPVFSHISLTLDDQWKLGLIGRNGRGKTTLLRLLLGTLHGTGRIHAGTNFCYFPAPAGQPERTARAVLTGLGGGCEEWRLVRELSLLGVDEAALDRPFCTLSPGEQAKAQLAALFTREHAFPLIDEPTNHLDQAGRRLLSAYLRKKRGFLLVSHDRALLDGCIDHVLSINKADIELQKGNFTTWKQARDRQDEFERNQNERLRREIGRLNEAARRASSWSDKAESAKYGSRNSGLRPDRGFIGHKSAKMMKRAKNAERRLESAAKEKALLLKNVERVDGLKLSPLHHHAARLLTLSDAAPCYSGKAVCAPVSLEITPGERIALAGGNGAGKSSLLRLLAGEKQDYTGTLTRASGLVVSYVPQCTDGLAGGLRTFAEGVDYSLFLTVLRKLGLDRMQFEKDMAGFSAGQKKKVLLARSLCEQAHLYLWDEPLNYMDLDSRMQIEQLLAEFQPTIVFVEHDAAFADAIATRTLALTAVSGARPSR